jgi:hypothetical protein
LLIEIVQNDTDKQVERKKRAKYNEEYEVDQHYIALLSTRLLVYLGKKMRNIKMTQYLHLQNKHTSWAMSLASAIISVQPLNVATCNKAKYELATLSKLIRELIHVKFFNLHSAFERTIS